MYLFRVGGNTYKIAFGYGVLYKSDLIDRVISATSQNEGNPAETIKNLIGLTAEMLLDGLQKKHKDQFGYDTPEEREKRIVEVCDLLDEYEEEHAEDEEPLNGFTLFADLQKEMERNGFLSQINRNTEQTAVEQDATVIPQDHQQRKKRGEKE